MLRDKKLYMEKLNNAMERIESLETSVSLLHIYIYLSNI